MNKLEALNVVMEKQEHGVTVPLALKISVGGKWHTVTIDREDKNIQKTVRVLVMMMLRSEVGKTSKIIDRSKELLDVIVERDPPKEYTVKVRVGTYCLETTVRAHSTLDARVMAYILNGVCPIHAEPLEVIDLALANTEIVT